MLQQALQKLPVFRNPTTHPLPPHGEAGRLEFPAHDRDHLMLRQTCAFFDFLKTGPILPRKSDHQRNLIVMDFDLHGN